MTLRDSAIGASPGQKEPATGFGAAFFSDVQHGGGGANIGFDFELTRGSRG